jgi:hypothetical protein
MTVQGMQQHEQSSVLRQEHLPPWGLTMEPAVVEIEEAVEAGMFAAIEDVRYEVAMRYAVERCDVVSFGALQDTLLDWRTHLQDRLCERKGCGENLGMATRCLVGAREINTGQEGVQPCFTVARYAKPMTAWRLYAMT